MPNLSSILNDQIRRLARREIRAQTKTTKRLTAQYRRDIASLKRQVAALQKTVAFLQRQEKRRVAAQPSAAKPVEGVRFRADGLKSHRARLGLSAADYGRLVGASGLSVYHLESGKARPRKGQLTKLVAVRGSASGRHSSGWSCWAAGAAAVPRAADAHVGDAATVGNDIRGHTAAGIRSSSERLSDPI